TGGARADPSTGRFMGRRWSRAHEKGTPPRAHSSLCGLESNDIAAGCRLPDGASGIGTDGAVTEFRRDSRRRTARRAACAVARFPWVSNRAKITDHGTTTIGEFVHVEFAQENGSGSFEAANDLGVLCGNPIFEQSTRGCGAHVCSINQIF